jgi:hypothetical protein
MKKGILYLFTSLTIFSCTSTDEEETPLNSDPQTSNLVSEKGYLEYMGGIQMEDGPTDLLVLANNLYAVRDNKIFQYSLSTPSRPSLKFTFQTENSTDKLGKLMASNGNIYATSKQENYLYELSDNLVIINQYNLKLDFFKPNIAFKDSQGIYWVGGSNGSYGILAKYKLVNGEFTLINYMAITQNEGNIESMTEANNYILASLANGNLVSIAKSTLAIESIATYQNEPGHEKWGHTLLSLNNKAYWANWGAGFATVDISTPTSLSIESVITNSAFQSEFPNAEGTNVYDVAYNAEKNLLCVANGWSGVLLIRPNSAGKVLDYIDPEYFQNRSVETKGNYIYTGNISGGMSGDLKGIQVFKINL